MPIKYNRLWHNKLFYAHQPGEERDGIMGLLSELAEDFPGRGLTARQIADRLGVQEALVLAILIGAIRRGDVIEDELGAFHRVKRWFQ